MKWDEITEVLIVGCGGAGAVAAITARDLGVQVLIVEKMEQGGGNTNTAMGSFLCGGEMEGTYQYLESISSLVFPTVEPEIIQAFAKECLSNREWLENLGAKTHVFGQAAFPQLPGAEAIEKRIIIGPNKKEENSFWAFLRTQLETRSIRTWFNSPARDLLTDPQGRVIGAVVQKEGQEKLVGAQRGVILACGGFEYNEWLKANYLKSYPFYALGSPGNTGEGIRMAQKVGADLWHMTGVSATLGFKAPEFTAAFMVRPAANSYLFVDQNGKRFTSEFVDIHAYNFVVDFFDPQSLNFPRIPCFLIFDEATRQAGQIGLTAIGYNRGLYEWSKNNEKEIRAGWVTGAESITALANKLNINPCQLKNTINQYNYYCQIGEDLEFHRPSKNLTPLEPGPYYAIELWPCLLNTQGGPRRNAQAQILYPNGRPIPGLYSAGELGSIFNLVYQGSGNLGECLAFGRIAGRAAAVASPVNLFS